MIPFHERDAVLEFKAAGRTHGTGDRVARALGPIDLRIDESEFVAIMGPSGSGKSTLLNLAGGLDKPTDGSVSLGGRPLDNINAHDLATLRRTYIGFVFQDLNLLPGLTALENVTLPLELSGASSSRCRPEAEVALQGVGMADKAHRFPENLSGGEQQRVAIARAVVGPRQLLLADEPTGALDTVTGERIMRLLRKQCESGRTVVLVTHDSSHAAWADRVVFLRDGRIVDETRSPGTVVT